MHSNYNPRYSSAGTSGGSWSPIPHSPVHAAANQANLHIDQKPQFQTWNNPPDYPCRTPHHQPARILYEPGYDKNYVQPRNTYRWSYCSGYHPSSQPVCSQDQDRSYGHTVVNND